ncbi:SDR family NAD(P)-dependent oxidoreductase [Robertkochia solimangrovi]|uniref:SDR family NAD(P)-dependent oxidoreductase n=1 Tax=Robertkochia solimangrovi TaxID=2213046 RepID=UPI00117F57E9|nr:SDR family NAD(P)-dependent oxidoreductase [Robertkochia solimangrovi]TRZ41612.1 short-chain dehydrogenase [Robertkochia solimangrovi]
MNEKSVAVVTEAGNGIGKDFARILADNHYEVVLAATKESYDKLSALSHDYYKLTEVDFTSEESLVTLKKNIYESYGKLDLLVNNAEIVNGFGHKIDQLNLKEVREVYEVNFFAVIRMIQLFNPLLKLSEDPRIINITSSLGDISKMKDDTFCYSGYSLTAYSTAKAALNMFTHLQCREYKPSKIRIYSFDPVNMKNCTYNSVNICEGVKEDFVDLISKQQ